ncbi:MAG: hypothetical protein Q4G68_01975 [Planctomycetia bacterium]|nr:hypothetical protein [Planctomycetia bacterium]
MASKSVESEKVPRRRQIDPTTCERDYTDAEIEFMNALDQYKRSSGRMFPTCSEILEVLLSLGYRKQESPQVAVIEPEEVIKTPPSGTPTFAPEGEHESQYVFSPADDYREPLMIF